jgi:pimeloyl-ACP methyl ester carboxylesterase
MTATTPASAGMSSSVTAGAPVERTVTVQSIETHLFEAGDPAAPPMVYLHGTFLGNLWLKAYERLARRFHVLVPDMPGFGLTARPDWMRDVSDYVLYFRDLLDALGLERPVIVGHSLGGWMALELAVWYPDRVSRLVASNAAGIRVKGAPIADIFAMSPQELLMTCFDDLSAAAPLIPPEINAEYIAAQYRQRVTLASLAWNPHYDPKLERRLAWVRCPTLIVWGEHDRLIPPVYAEVLAKAIPNARVELLSGTGHMPMFERAEAWADAVIAFAADPTPSPGSGLAADLPSVASPTGQGES